MGLFFLGLGKSLCRTQSGRNARWFAISANPLTCARKPLRLRLAKRRKRASKLQNVQGGSPGRTRTDTMFPPPDLSLEEWAAHGRRLAELPLGAAKSPEVLTLVSQNGPPCATPRLPRTTPAARKPCPIKPQAARPAASQILKIR